VKKNKEQRDNGNEGEENHQRFKSSVFDNPQAKRVVTHGVP